ncbi:matrix metallo ase-19-like, partial [Brachionus plicatilis]
MFNYIFRFNILFILILNQVAIDADVSKRNALDYLNKFGYVKEPNRKSKGPLSLQDPEKTLQNSLKKFQSIHGLKITGILDKATIKKIESPRCIKPDFPIARPSSKKGGLKMLKLGLFVTASKWKKKKLKYAVFNENKELQGRTRAIIANAFKFWSDRSGISFKEVHPNAKHDLSIKFGARNHGDAYPFDGPGGVLAHAFFPEDGRIHFDEDENFTDKTKNGVNLQTVAVHEFGHALGLDHSLVKGAVMNPYYKGYDENFKLGKDDIKAIQSLYGKPRRKNQKAKSKKKQKNKRPNANPKKKKKSSKISTTKSSTKTTT